MTVIEAEPLAPAVAPGEPMRADIAAGWRRVQLSGLCESMEVSEQRCESVDRSSRLMVAAAPVLDRMADDLTDTRYAILLADQDARIIDRRSAAGSSLRALDAVKAIPGLRYCEQVSGVNSLATAYELRRPIAVIGAEHFLESLRVFCCYGAPIIHPLTRRLEGVLDISGPARDRTALLKPFVLRAVEDIQQRLLDSSRDAEKRLLSAFQAVAARRKAAVLALGDDLIVSNPAATDLLRSEDHVMLRKRTADVARSAGSLRTTMRAVSGNTLNLLAQGVLGTTGVIITITAHPGKRPSSPAGPPSPGALEVRAKVSLITGEPGTGRTSTAIKLAGSGAAVFDAVAEGGMDWLAAARTSLGGAGVVVVDNVDQLSSRAAASLRVAIRESHGPVVLTSGPQEQLTGDRAALVASALTRTDLRPVREYGPRFAELAYAVLREHHPKANMRFTPSALEVLATQPWPGNIRELIAVIEHAVSRRTSGDITDRDLPASHAAPPPARLTKLERVERDTIVAVLQSANGHKVAAAAELGIGRTTLYQRLRHYRIPG